MLKWLLFLLARHSVSTVKVRTVPFHAVRGGEDTDMGLECLPSRQPAIYCFDLFRYHSEWYSVPDYVSNLVHQNTHRALGLSVTPFLYSLLGPYTLATPLQNSFDKTSAEAGSG